MSTNWYYAQNGTQSGPISEPELLRLAGSGQVDSNTLVWHEGLEDWQAFGIVLPSAFGSSHDAPQLQGVAVGSPYKDTLVQQMREGVDEGIPGTVAYAGFWIRFVAKMVDGLVMMIPQILVRLGVEGLLGSSQPKPGGNPFTPDILLPLAVVTLISTVISGAYEVFFTAQYGATLGKKAMGLRVVCEDGTPMTLRRSFGRYFSTWVSGLTLGVGYIMAGFDSKKRALHDRIASTMVIKNR